MLIADGTWNAYDCPAPEDDRTIEEELDLLSTFTFAARAFAHRSGGHVEDDWAAEKHERAAVECERAVARDWAAMARKWVVERKEDYSRLFGWGLH